MTDYRAYARKAARAHGLNPDLFVRQLQQESGFDPNARSKYAIGIAQFTPDTARSLGVDPTDPIKSIDAAARLMKSHLDRFGNIRDALVAYNAGPGRVGKPLYRETAKYLAIILGSTAVGGKINAPAQQVVAPATIKTQRIVPAKTDTAGAFIDALRAKAEGRSGSALLSGTAALKTGRYTTPARVEDVARAVHAKPPATRAAQAGGGWGGSQGIVATARDIAATFSAPVTSRKRSPATNAAAGGAAGSDHLTTATNAYAEDYGAAGSNAVRLAQRIAKAYGVAFTANSYESGGVVTAGGKRFRVQILQGAAIGHADHVHVGVRRL